MSKAGAQRAAANQFPDDRHVLKFPERDRARMLEEGLKDRLNRLSDLVDAFMNSTYNLVAAEKSPLRPILEELVVKTGALRWIVRIASHASGPVRQKLWADIDGALTDLEQTAGAYERIQNHHTRSFPVDRAASLRMAGAGAQRLARPCAVGPRKKL